MMERHTVGSYFLVTWLGAEISVHDKRDEVGRYEHSYTYDVTI